MPAAHLCVRRQRHVLDNGAYVSYWLDAMVPILDGQYLAGSATRSARVHGSSGASGCCENAKRSFSLNSEAPPGSSAG